MDVKEYLTNEALLKEFGSQFELVKHAIGMAKHMIRSGKDAALHSDNPALEVLEQLAHGNRGCHTCADAADEDDEAND